MYNDTRGWVLAGASGVACIFGAFVICVDFVVRLFPGKADFEIRKSGTFLSSSLSLSFGVMLFSALYNMLPEAKKSLVEGGLSKSAASYVLIGSFLGGVMGIQILSRLSHHFMPSHVVGCEHTHDDGEESDRVHNHHDTRNHARPHEHDEREHLLHDDELDQGKIDHMPIDRLGKVASESDALTGSSKRPPPLTTRVSSFLTGAKTTCDEQGPCYGYSDPCGNECLNNKGLGSLAPNRRALSYGSTISRVPQAPVRASTQPMHALREEREPATCPGSSDDNELSSSTATSPTLEANRHPHDLEGGLESTKQHHHHVPKNAFLSISVQTSVAIALHKLPEGFITYATNHADPKLGFAIFLALFIHNLTEGFALAFPLYLATQSRWKSILAAAILGGASQPLGAGVAALWFHAANNNGMMPSQIVYGCMFAVTSGIMTSVALELFSASLGRTHSKTLCIVWAFVGMVILGLSNALTA